MSADNKDPPAPASPLATRLRAALSFEFGQLRPRLMLVTLLARPLPSGSFGEQRAELLRLLGCSVGPGVRVLGMPSLSGGDAPLAPNLSIGAGSLMDVGCVLELGDKLTIGEDVRIGREALILTTTHDLGPKEHRAGPLVRKPVTINRGATVGARAVILPGVTIGEGAHLLASSVLGKDMPPGSRWGGVPAKPLPAEPASVRR